MFFIWLLQACGTPATHNTNTQNKWSQSAIDLTVNEGFKNPLGFYDTRPRFSWKIDSASHIKYQSAYQIQVANDVSFKADNILWDSKKVTSRQNAWVNYQGPKLQSRQKVYWRVKIWDEHEQGSNWSEINHLELGLVDNDDWQAKWIGHPKTDATPFYTRKHFVLEKPIQHARLYITAKGVFQPYINGLLVSKDVMTPGWTPYHKRIETLTYDVTTLLTQGDNAIGAIVADGWHSGRIFSQKFTDFRLPKRLLAQLEITYKDGSRQSVVSDDSWQVSKQGPIQAADNYDGETFDARLTLPDWHTPKFDKQPSDARMAQGWVTAIAESLDLQVLLKPKRHAPARVTKTLSAIDIVSEKNGVVIYDMGQNMVGVPQITVPAIKDQTIKLRFSEALEHGKFYVKSFRSAKNIDLYIPQQDGVITYQPTFTFHGYRYLELSGFDTSVAPKLSWVKGQVIHSDFDVHNNFTSNHSKLNRLSDNVSWGLRGNFLDIPTDCPQRDERLGWTGDAQIFVSTSMYKADVYAFWAAWLESLREEQSIEGAIPKFVPFRQFLSDGASSAWGDAATIVPWELYQYTGDTHVLAENYTMMKRWVLFSRNQSVDYISNMNTYGDWLQPHSKLGREGDTHPDLISTAYFARSVELTAKTARILGFDADAKQYELLHQNIKQKFRNYFFDQNLDLLKTATKRVKRENGKRYGKAKVSTIHLETTQTSYLLPLTFGLFDEDEQEMAVLKLLDLLEQSDRHLRTGFLGTPMLHRVLQRFGHSDVMYDILLKESYPSWFYSINHGATTTWERWDSYSLTEGYNKANMNSLNHYAYGAVAQWFYNGLLGIQATTPGFKTFQVNPQFSHKLNDLQGSVPTINGNIKVSWSIKDTRLNMSVSVPKNSQGTLLLPAVSDLLIIQNGRKIQGMQLNPGQYQISGQLRYSP